MTRATGPAFRVPFRRRREGKTDFANRLALVKGDLPRMVIRRSNCNVLVQFITFDPLGDKTMVTVSGKHLAKLYKWPSKRNSWTAYLVGLSAGKAAKAKGVSDFVVDLGMYAPSKGSLLFAAVKGAADSGLTTAYDAEMVPEQKLQNPPESIKSMFEQVKKKISG